MAIIVDPDNLDRRQIIFGTEVNGGQQISARDVGAVVDANYLDATGGVTTGASLTFTDAGATFQTDSVAQGDVLCMFTGEDAGHFIIDSVDSETQLTLDSAEHPNFSGDTGIVYDIRELTGGTILDGLTEQAIYSFGKEEWRTDSETFGGDDLIRHEFPFEAITREQMEIGGGTSHDNWDYNVRDSEYTKKKIRTGGWADKNSVGTTLTEYSGIITLGDLDADAQVYYQQVNESETPVTFTFTGPVNEAILTFTDGGSDNRTYLKLFVRKKYRTYSGSQISDIGVSQLETIVNRFPLSHQPDAAIVETDGAILGNGTFRGQGTALESGSDGDKTASGTTFTSAGSTFTSNGVAVGDILNITSGSETGYYTIESVDSETALTIAGDADFTSWASTESTLDFSVTSTNIVAGSTDGALADVDSDTGTLTSATGGFSGTVTAGDMVIITEAASDHRGVYKVVSQDSDTVLTLNTSDRIFTTQSSINFTVVEPGMYLEYKEDTITLASTGNLTFTDADPDTITRTSGSWITDGITAGSVIVITGSTSNDGSYTVASTTATVATLVATDTLTAEGPVAATATAYDGFKRTIASVTYSFHWRLFGIDALLSDCYQFVQHQLRQDTDIDYGPGTSRGDVTDLLMAYAAPTGTTFDMYIDNLNAADTNNVTYQDATGGSRLEDFVAAGTITFNNNLQNDASAEYTMFFTNSDAGTPGSDFGTPSAIIVQDADTVNIAGNVSAASSVSFTYDYDNNVQRGGGSDGTDAPVTVVGIGLATAQYVLLQGTIERSKANTFALVAALERNYSNP